MLSHLVRTSSAESRHLTFRSGALPGWGKSMTSTQLLAKLKAAPDCQLSQARGKHDPVVIIGDGRVH